MIMFFFRAWASIETIFLSSAVTLDLFIYLFIWGFTSLSTLYRSYHDG